MSSLSLPIGGFSGSLLVSLGAFIGTSVGTESTVSLAFFCARVVVVSSGEVAFRFDPDGAGSLPLVDGMALLSVVWVCAIAVPSGMAVKRPSWIHLVSRRFILTSSAGAP